MTTKARLPKTVSIEGCTEIDGVTHADALAFYVTLDLKELRRRQDLCRQQQRMAYEQAERENFRPNSIRDHGVKVLNVTDMLLTEAVGYITFEDWGQ